MSVSSSARRHRSTVASLGVVSGARTVGAAAAQARAPFGAVKRGMLCLLQSPPRRVAVQPNPSLKPSPNGGPPGPRGRAVYHSPHGPGVPPLGPA